MGNFYRVIRLAFRHKFEVGASLLCSVIVAVLWGGNITAILPVVDVVMNGNSIPQWADQKRDAIAAQIDELTADIAAKKKELAAATGDARDELEDRVARQERLVARKRTERARYVNWIGPLAHQYLPTTAFRTLLVVCTGLVIGTLLKSLFRIIGSYYTSQLGNLIQFELRKEFYRRTLRLDLATFNAVTSGDLMNRLINNVGVAAAGAMNVFGLAFREPAKAIVCLAIAAWVSWQLLLLTLISVPAVGYAIHRLAKSLKRANRKAIEELTGVYNRVDETASGFKVIKAFTRESRERARFHRTSKQLYRRTMRIAFYDALVSPITETLGLGIILAAVLSGGYLVLNQKTHLFGIRVSEEPLTHGLLTLFYCMLAGASDPVRRLTAVFNSLQQGAAASDHLYEVMDRESRITDAANPQPLPAQLGAIEFRDLSFAYKPDEPVLVNVNLRIEPGETVAIIGPNGCGKSTLLNLVPRFYDPVNGVVTLGGIDLRQLRRRAVCERIGIVTQETLLFDDTVAENIRYGRPEATREEVVEAARRAHADRFITEVLSEGYETNVGMGGNRLSGGQRQRIALARAILRDPDILMLDEATSQIDVESEALIHNVLEEFTRGRTALIVTHRPSTLALADRIVVMDAGHIVDVGTYSELAGRCSLFRRLAHVELRESA